MNTLEKPVFDDHQVALELGYTEEQIQQFQDLSDVLDYWSDELEARRISVADVPKPNPVLYSAYCAYHKKMNNRKMQFHAKYKHLF